MLRRVAIACGAVPVDLGGVFVEGGVADVVDGVLVVSMAADDVDEPGGGDVVPVQAGDRVHGLGGGLPVRAAPRVRRTRGASRTGGKPIPARTGVACRIRVSRLPWPLPSWWTDPHSRVSVTGVPSTLALRRLPVLLVVVGGAQCASCPPTGDNLKQVCLDGLRFGVGGVRP